jgi:hydroxymethylbilane synthase
MDNSKLKTASAARMNSKLKTASAARMNSKLRTESEVSMKQLILGTRGSKLALAQSEMMAAALRSAHPGLQVELKIISTKGDRVLDVALSAVGDKGLFVKELEQALLDHEVDLCVHSCKDLPSELPAGLTLAAFPERADVRDVLVLHAAGRVQQAESEHTPLSILHSALPQGAVVGTSSLRRAAQLRALRPDLVLRDVRGNVDTRLRKLVEGQYDAIVLAAAGVMRLGLWDGVNSSLQFASEGQGEALSLPVVALEPTITLPAVAQGILAVECRADDRSTLELLAVLDHQPTRAAALAERAFLRRLEGGCQVPMAAYAQIEGSSLRVQGLVAALDGRSIVQGELSGPIEAGAELGATLAEQLLAQGAEAILEEVRAGQSAD